MTNNLGRTEVSVGQTQKETAINNSDGILDAALTATLTVTWSGAEALKTLTTAQLRQNLEFVMGGSTTEPTPVLRMANVQRGIVLVTNNLAVALTVEDYTSSNTVSVAAGQTEAMYVAGSTIESIFASGGISDAANDGNTYARRSAGWRDIGLGIVTVAGTTDTLALTDAFDTKRYTNGSAVAVTVPTNASVAFIIGTIIYIEQAGAGAVTIAGDVGVTVNGSALATTAQFQRLVLIKVGTDEWTVYAAGSGSGFTAASTTEILTGTETAKGGTPDSIAALWEKGSGVALAGTISLGEGGLFHITAGTGPITDIDFATAKDGRWARLVFDVDATITHSANLVLPGSIDHSFVAGERAIVWQDNGDVVHVVPLRARRKQYMGTFGGAPGSSVIVFAFMSNEALNFPASLSGSVVKAKTAATAQTDFDIQKNGVSQGTIRFAAAGTVATYVGISAFSLASGDYIEIVSPGSADATLANIFFTLEATAAR